MPRPYFLQRIAGRVSRQILGVHREPVHVTERDLRCADVALAFTAGVCSMGMAVLFILTFVWRPECL